MQRKYYNEGYTVGTRHLIAVQHNNEYKIAQYGQWDGYPGGQGVDILDFCIRYLLRTKSKTQFKKQLEKIKLITRNDALHKIGIDANENSYLTEEESNKFDVSFPYFDRSLGHKILKNIYDDLSDCIYLQNSIKFAADSIFCEWTYIIDLDTEKLEIYKGFNTTPLCDNDRFFWLSYLSEKNYDGTQYHPVKLLHSFRLDNLPNRNVFLRFLDKKQKISI